MPITQITPPFRQMIRAYAAILNIDRAVSSHSLSRVTINEVLTASPDLLCQDEDLEPHFSNLDRHVADLERRVSAIDHDFDQRVSGALREHIYLPPTSHWSKDKPFMPFSTCSAADFIHVRYAELCEAIAHPVQFHRKVCEWVFVLHHLEQFGVLKEAFRGVGFGVGMERLPSVFASRGASVSLRQTRHMKLSCRLAGQNLASIAIP